MTKRIDIHRYKTGRVKRYAYYEDLRAAACAQALLVKSSHGWAVRPIRRLTIVDKYYVYAEIIPRRRKSK